MGCSKPKTRRRGKKTSGKVEVTIEISKEVADMVSRLAFANGHDMSPMAEMLLKEAVKHEEATFGGMQVKPRKWLPDRNILKQAQWFKKAMRRMERLVEKEEQEEREADERARG